MCFQVREKRCGNTKRGSLSVYEISLAAILEKRIFIANRTKLLVCTYDKEGSLYVRLNDFRVNFFTGSDLEKRKHGVLRLRLA